RAKAFYEKLGFRLDIDIVNENFRGIQFTPPRSEASIIFGKGVTSARPGSAELVLAVDNVDAAREDLIARGVKVSDVFHYAGGPLTNIIEPPWVWGRHREGRSSFSCAFWETPGGTRGRRKETTPPSPGGKGETARPKPLNREFPENPPPGEEKGQEIKEKGHA